MTAEALHINDKLEKVPDYWKQELLELLEFLSDANRFARLRLMLRRSCLMLEGGGYQMPIQSVGELLALKEALEDAVSV
jgi:hypothetical protein